MYSEVLIGICFLYFCTSKEKRRMKNIGCFTRSGHCKGFDGLITLEIISKIAISVGYYLTLVLNKKKSTKSDIKLGLCNSVS